MSVDGSLDRTQATILCRVYRVLEQSPARYTVEQMAGEARVTLSQAREACDTLWHAGLVVRYGAYPDLRYRGHAIPEAFLTAAGKRERAQLLATLEEVVA